MNEEQLKKYWERRSEEQGERTVGFNNKPLTQQDENYKIRTEFISRSINTELKVLDYGCGIGRYSDLFEDEKYIGVDITNNLLSIAKKKHSTKKYILLNKSGVEEIAEDFECFFSSTVLQYNSDEIVREIIASLKGKNLKEIVLYENTSKKRNRSHIKFRKAEEYIGLFNEVFDFKSRISKHSIHGQEHSVIKMVL